MFISVAEDSADVYAASLKKDVPGVKPVEPDQPSSRIPETAAG